MLKKSLCLVLGFMCIGEVFGSSKELPLGSFKSSGKNDLSKVEDHNVRKEETALKQKSSGYANTQLNKKLRIEEYKTNTSEDEPNIVIMSDKQENGNINNVIESHIDEKEAINSDPNIQEEATSGSGSSSNDSSFEGNIDEENFAEEHVVNEENLLNKESCKEDTSYSEDEIGEIYLNICDSQLWVGYISEIKDKDQRDEYINRVNRALVDYINYTDWYNKKNSDKIKKDNPSFLFALMGMLNSYSNELDPGVNVLSILQDLWPKKSEIGEDKRAQGRLIYNWLAENEEDFLGEYYYD